MSSTRPLISCSAETRDIVKSLKRGGESYDELLRKMAAQYDPAAAPDDAPEKPLSGGNA